jgi:Mg2+-importing ATPase
VLAATSLGVVAAAVALPFTPVGAWFGFVPPSPAFLLAIGGLVAVYLVLAQGVKTLFYRLRPPRGRRAAAILHLHLPLLGRR